MEIILGPLVGLESNNKYSISILLSKEISEKDIVLIQNQKQINYLSKTELQNHVFIKYMIDIEIKDVSYEFSYSFQCQNQQLSDGANTEWKIYIPSNSTVPKIAFASCNGNSSKYVADLDDSHFIMWDKLIQQHRKQNYEFHAMILCGDQIYADTVWELDYFQKHKVNKKTKSVINHKIIDKIDLENDIELFYEQLYIDNWNRQPIRDAMSSIPSVMMWDDHDIFDGWGSYPKNLEQSDIFQLIFKVAKKYFELFQIKGKTNQALLNVKNSYSQKINFRNFEIIVLDNRSCRTNRNGEEIIMSSNQYADLEQLFDENLFIDTHSEIEKEKSILFVIPVPIAHLDYQSDVERWLKWIFKSRFRKSYNDDSLDQWSHEKHKDEHKKMLDLIFKFGDTFQPKYLTIISGDVHSAGTSKIISTENGRKVNQLVASAIVHKPLSGIKQFFINMFSNDVIDVEGYTVDVEYFSYKWRKTLYDRNFGFLYKAIHKGIKAYIVLEHIRDNPDKGINKYRIWKGNYDFKQLSIFDKPNAQNQSEQKRQEA